MEYCLICDKEIIDEDKHIYTYHKQKPENNNKGDFLCPLCKVKVGSRQRHYCSDLHRHNVRENESNITYDLKEYIIHFDKYCNETTVKALGNKKLEEEDPYWLAAKQDLSEEDYKKLKEYVYDRRKNISKYTRHSGFGRFNRTYESIKRHG